VSRGDKMSEQFISAIKSENNWEKTENDADSLKSTSNNLIDLFATIGALRDRRQEDIEKMFSLAFTEDNLLATKMSFYARNIRGGLGERRTPKIVWKWLAKIYPSTMRKNIYLVPVFGRWDDLFEFIGTSLEEDAWKLITEQFNEDMNSLKTDSNVSLLGKWLKSINTSSKESVKIGKETAKRLGLTERQYRKSLSLLRERIDVVERKMSNNKWKLINYSGVPSKAMNNYRNAFKKHDESGFVSYLEKVSSGEAKINSSTLYPYDIIEKIFDGEYNEVLELQWKALPNYVEGDNNILIMADVSGSMEGRPMATSVGLAIYFAERNHGVFHNKFMTFSGNPDFVELKGNTLYEKTFNAKGAAWMQSTDIEKAFKLILDTAINNNLQQDDLPKSLIIISDMEFDYCTRTGRKTYYQHMKDLYLENGYEIPKVVFWNVDARQNTFHAQVEDGVQFASGQSTSVFSSIIKNSELGAYEMMMETLSDPMYDEITI
jgi:hypothetical protein